MKRPAKPKAATTAPSKRPKASPRSSVKEQPSTKIDPSQKAIGRKAVGNIYRQEYQTRDDPNVELNLERILMWHKVLANITGGLSLRISKRSLSRVDLTNWIVALDNLLHEMKMAQEIKNG